MILVGIDDTDILGSPGTNQLARAIVERLKPDWRCVWIARHQLFFDPRVPFTSKNGSASIALEPRGVGDLDALTNNCRDVMREWFIEGSDPGLCVTAHVPEAITNYGKLCQRDLVTQAQARGLAAEHGIHLEGLGGTQGGVIGALAAVGLAITRDDGRLVQMGEWPDDLSGPQPVSVLHARQLTVLDLDRGDEIQTGSVDVGKHLRPNVRGGRYVLYVRREMTESGESLQAVKLT